MNYKKVGNDYIANEGYLFENKNNKYTCKIMSLSEDDSIDNYNIIEEPVYVEEVEETEEEVVEEI